MSQLKPFCSSFLLVLEKENRWLEEVIERFYVLLLGYTLVKGESDRFSP